MLGAKWGVGDGEDIVFATELHEGGVGEEGVDFDLIDCWRDSGVGEEGSQVVGCEI